MAKKPVKFDPDDGLIVERGWSVGDGKACSRAGVHRDCECDANKVRAAASMARGASYIELFSGPGRSLIRGTKRIIDGSPLVAFNAAQASGAPFTEMHLNDFDAAKSSAVEQRIRALGGAAICYSDHG